MKNRSISFAFMLDGDKELIRIPFPTHMNPRGRRNLEVLSVMAALASENPLMTSHSISTSKSLPDTDWD